ncbi:MAG: hypothetical protein RML49_00010 [Verrucomicrobiae bacterium]|nr:hypothetical protein [Verrucomicrobiae bacterium]
MAPIRHHEHRKILSRSLPILILLAAAVLYAAPPAWWTARQVLDPSRPADDYALVRGKYFGVEVSWEKNQRDYKPNSFGNVYYKYAPTQTFSERYQLWERNSWIGGQAIRRYVTDHEEIMAFIARPRSQAVGSSANVGGSIHENVNIGPGSKSNFRDTESDHSGQFTRRIQQVQPFYDELIIKIRP